MKVFCPQHKIDFFTPRRNPIRCENRGHVLGEFVFHVDANAPGETVWQYCCNCEHFCPIDLDQSPLKACPACGRGISLLYVCDRCFTFSFESSTPIQTKNFTLTSDGVPQPSCPGCFQESAGDLREHDCGELGASFITALNSCPICMEHLDAGPVFPSSAAQYLRKTKPANKLTVTFDYVSGLFIPLDDGEFVLVNKSTHDGRPFVLPRLLRFESKREFYELYQDYFHCANVDAGEVHIVEPAFVERIGEGWKLESIGVLEIVNADAKPEALASDIPIATESPVRERSALFSASLLEEAPAVIETPRPGVIEKPVTMTCPDCGTLVESGYTDCWNCGHSTQPNVATPKRAKQTTAVTRRIVENDDELTIQQDLVDLQRPIFSWALAEPSRTSPTSSTVRRIAIVVSGLLLLTLGGFLLKGPLSQLRRSADAQQVASNLHSGSDSAPRVEVTTAVAEGKAQPIQPIDTAEQELRKLRETRIGASASDRLTVLQLFANAEKQYPSDYRFPYERAKLAISDLETKSHDEAFDALSLAAEEAIKTDKTKEMLEGLEADKFADFHKLSHGHREWTQIIEALNRKDATLLTSN
jgi:hypothetical protein